MAQIKATQRQTASTPALAAALAPTGHPHPLLTEQAREHTDPVLTPAQSTPALNDGLGAWITAPVETELLDIDCDRDPDLVHAPFLGAQVVNYQSAEYGNRTEVWVHYGTSTGAVSPAKAREVLAAMRDFLPQLGAVIAVAEAAEAGA
ncbi:hypothetical protein [Streptomyces nigra]|uniref:hypothetical protein n=1 Tax=Streptomyces nigra TaxID=1827580 RepID=UPI0030D4DEB9